MDSSSLNPNFKLMYSPLPVTVMVPETMTVNEGDTEVVVCLSLSENLTDPNTIVVDANTEDGSAGMQVIL